MIFPLFITYPPGPPEAPQEVIQAAEEGLPYWLSQIPPSQMENFGFSEDDNLDEAVLGRPFHEYLINRAEVVNYEEGDTIYDVLTGGSE